ncbi:MAG: ATP-binding cassette domain-containing protein [Christensenellales bacterium]
MKIIPFTKTYDGRTVLDMPELELTEGSIYAVIGANGSGKSTMARILAGALPCDSGSPVLDRAVSVGYMPQKSYAFRMSAEKNMLLSGGNAKKAKELMERLGIISLARNRADKLSGGETSRMALARLMMGKYGLVILDEPTAAMDMESTALSEELIRDYCRETGCTLLLVTHSLRQARRLGDEAIFLHEGKLWERGSVEKVLFAPEKPETAQFLEFYGV